VSVRRARLRAAGDIAGTWDDNGEVGYLLYPSGVLKIIYLGARDSKPADFKTRAAYDKHQRFKAKADAAIEAERILTGREPDLDEVLARVFKIEALEAYMAGMANGTEKRDLLDVLLGGAPS
jgi:hypothetical protein